MYLKSVFDRALDFQVAVFLCNCQFTLVLELGNSGSPILLNLFPQFEALIQVANLDIKSI